MKNNTYRIIFLAAMAFASTNVFGVPGNGDATEFQRGKFSRSSDRIQVEAKQELQTKLWEIVTKKSFDENDGKELKTLIDAGVDINCKNDDGDTPLLYATKTQNLPLLTWLIKFPKTDVNAVDKNGETALLWTFRNRKNLTLNRESFSNLTHLAKTAGEGNYSFKTSYSPRGNYRIIIHVRHPQEDVAEEYVSINNVPTQGQLITLDWLKDQEQINKLELDTNIKLINQLFSREDTYFCAKNKAGNTSLIFATESNDLNLVKKLLHHIQADTVDVITLLSSRKNKIAWSTSALKQQSQKFSKLIDFTNNMGRTALLLAIDSGYTEIAKLLIQYGADVNLTGLFQKTPLCLAIDKNDDFMIKHLVEHKADLNKSDAKGNTPLLTAIANNNEAVVKYLVEKGVDINKADINGYSPLAYAVLGGNENVIKYLVKYGADIDENGNVDGSTPLFIAVESGKESVVRYLAEQGADVNKERKDGMTPLLVATINGNENILQHLIEHDADINKETKDGVTPLYVAVEGGNENIVKYFVEHGADANKTTTDGVTPLFIAIQTQVNNIAKFLIDHGADINKGRNNGVTPMIIAAYGRNYDMVQYLIAQPYLNINAKCDNGYTALGAAKLRPDNDDIINILERAGATE